MIIAVAQEGPMVCQHFGHCRQFVLYDTEEKQWNMVNNDSHQCGTLPAFLKEQGTDVIIVGGMGARPQQLFNQLGIQVIVGVQGLVTQAVENCMKGQLSSSGAVCSHHDDEGGCQSGCHNHN
ncbi:MAG: dinitrogenase iron-molybdenum cofactor [Syntrophomonadaceae bacterium]|nr:dinitrogenase iron-molybdenum cofactor [Syntrophomonadaceae bacterium]